MHLNCPHCHSPIEVIEAQPRDVVCPSCGSTIQLDPGATSAWLPTDGPKRLGKFEFLEQVGVGSFGTVYKARDTELDRTVAIKIPRAGNVPRPEDVDRFLREAKSAAQLKHPSIVGLYDAGQSDGTCYLVSEFIQGATLAERLSAKPFSFRQSAELIAEVADALQHAHEHGVIHRDVKPSNIMLEHPQISQIPQISGRKSAQSAKSVKSADGSLRPRLMDFGLAKRAADEITMTLDGQVLGTPAYMSPEQAKGEVRKVDARSDIYSLGVILYELLTGELPFRGQTRMLLVQVINDEPRPPRRLNDRIPRDLETICLKAMAKEAGRRYQDARGFADDLRRFLKGEPIRARRAGAGERAHKWMKRRPAVAALLAVSLLAAVSLAVVGIWYNVQLQRTLDDTRLAKIEIEQLKSKERQLLESQFEIANQEVSVRSLGSIVVALHAYHEKHGRFPSPTIADPTGRPLLSWRVALLPFFGHRYDQLYRQFMLDEPWDSEHNLALLEYMPVFYAPARGSTKQPGMTYFQVLVGPGAGFEEGNHTRIQEFTDGTSLTFLVVEAGEPMPWTKPSDLRYEVDGPLPKLGGLTPDGFHAAMCDGAVYLISRSKDEPTLRAWITRNGGEPEGGKTPAPYELFRSDVPKSKLAAQKARLTARKAKLGPDHADVLAAMDNLAKACRDAGQGGEAIVLYEELVKLRKAKLGSEHADTLNSMKALSSAYRSTGRRPEAILLLEEVFKLRKAALGLEHPDTRTSMTDLTDAYRSAGQLVEAISLVEESLQLLKAKPGPEHSTTLFTMGMLAGMYRSAGRQVEAISLDEARLQLLQTKLGPEHPTTLDAMNALAWFLIAAPDAKYHDAPRAVELAAKAARAAPEKDAFWGTLGTARYRAGEWKRAIADLEKGVSLRKPNDVTNAYEGFFLAMAHWQLGEKVKAREWFDKAVQWMEKGKKDDAELKRFRAEAAELLGAEKK